MRRGRAALTTLGLIALLLLVVPGVAAACEADSEGNGPQITEARLSPASLTSAGGTGVIFARVEDNCAVGRVEATINSTEGPFVAFELLPGEEDINTNHRVYRGEFEIPANFQEAPIDYQGIITAEDIDGAFAETFAGDIEVAGVPPFDEAPLVSAASVTPTVWGGLGGTSTIEMTATDLRGIANAYAIVTLPNSREREIQLEPISSSLFIGSLVLPGNPGASPRSYAVAVFAQDDIGQTTGVSAGSVTVEPKGTPNPGFITLGPGFLRFGQVTLGGHAEGTATMTNTGKPGSPPVTGFLRSSEAQFVLPGATEGGVPFTLAAGQEEEFVVGFQPSTVGPQVGRLILARDDGRQPNSGVSLFGSGAR
ncbi:MAG TPA: hypothetical protein VGH14_04305 [Solirubrobacterales bacterium]